MVIGAPVSEEIVFRGGLLQGLAQVTSARVANFITALIFALVHYYVIQFLPVFFSGLYLGWIYLKRENLVEPIAAHATKLILLVSCLIFSYKKRDTIKCLFDI